jgi:VanZ family protein
MHLIRRVANAGLRLRLTVLALWTFALLGLLLAPIPESAIPVPGGFRGLDKVAHCCLFAVTELVCLYAGVFLQKTQTRILVATALTLIIGAGTELGQSLVSRDPSFLDFLADLVGLAVGLVSGIWLLRSHFPAQRLNGARTDPDE